ncbi:MAG: hypothetical protein KAT68_09425 [Bacteroidales bacterium]|nr:hypothetical protein [Bacteroidales bacterium]
MKKTLIILSVFVIVFTSCKKDDYESTPLKNNYFEFVVSSNYLINNTSRVDRVWVIVYSADNEILIKQELQNGITYTFDTIKISKSGLKVQTILYRDYAEDYSSDDYYNFSTYTNITPGIWKFGSEPQDELEPIGTITLNINDIELYNYYIVELRSSYTYGFSHNESICEIAQYFDTDDVWLMLLNQDEAPYYKWFGDVALNGAISVSSSELDQMSDYVDMAFPANTSMYIYIESEDDLSTDFWDYYLVYLNSWDDGQTSIRAYFPGDVFSGYYTYLIAWNDYITETMLTSRGSVPNEFEQIDATITISNSNVNDFNATINGTTDVCYHYWSHTEFIETEEIDFNYRVYGPTENTFVYDAPPIPEDIKTLNSQLLVLGKLEYSYSGFNEYDILNGYEEYIKAYKKDQRNLIQEGVKRLWKYIYSQETKNMNKVDDKEVLKKIKQELYDF